jgi:hypothetical protein
VHPLTGVNTVSIVNIVHFTVFTTENGSQSRELRSAPT